ncbi:hypothetical protein [Tepidimonas alkaliphilus]|nr:hypothetical protein [Tepidimonas alkaliphilus]
MRPLVLAIAAGWAAWPSLWAQSLGAAQGTVQIGRPLDVVVAAPLEGDDPAAVCAQAWVRFGDLPLPASEVALTVVRDEARGSGLRVRTRSVVNEPVVQLRVTLGCGAPLTRIYTLLPQAPEVVAEVAMPAASAAAAAPAATALPVARAQAPAAAALDPAGSAPAAPRTPKSGSPRAEATSSRASAPRDATRSAASAARPRPPRDPLPTPVAAPSWSSRLSAELLTPVAAAPEGAPRLSVEPLAFESDEAFVQFLLARSLGLAPARAEPEASPAAEGQPDAAAGAVATPAAAAADAAAAPPAAAPQPPASPAPQDELPWTWIGAGAAALLLAALAALRWRQRSGASADSGRFRWLSKAAADGEGALGPSAQRQDPVIATVTASAAGAAPATTPRETPAKPLRRVEASATSPLAAPTATAVPRAALAEEGRGAAATRTVPPPTPQAPAAAAAQPPSRPAPSPVSAGPAQESGDFVADWDAAPQEDKAAAARVNQEAALAVSTSTSAAMPASLDVAALHELWQRVDFLVDLGQVSDAIAALRSFVLAHPGASEAPYRRWWALAQASGLDAGLAQRTYEAHYQRPWQPDGLDASLLDDAEWLQRLQAVWPKDEARRLIEAALASAPGHAGEPPLAVRTLAAWDDLMLLHGVLQARASLPESDPNAAPSSPAGKGEDDHVLEFDLGDWTPPPAAPQR